MVIRKVTISSLVNLVFISLSFISCGALTNEKEGDLVENEIENVETDDLSNTSSSTEKANVKFFAYGFHHFPDTITKLNENQFLIIDSVPEKGLLIKVSNSEIRPIEIEYFYKECYVIEELKGVVLENVQYAFVYYTNFDECPSSTFQSLYIVTNSEIKQMASIHNEADEERDEDEPNIEEEKIIYLPALINNAVQFKEVGFFESISSDNVKRIFTNRIPINEAPQNIYIVEYLRVKENIDTMSIKVEFYKWDGNKSTLIKK